MKNLRATRLLDRIVYEISMYRKPVQILQYLHSIVHIPREGCTELCKKITSTNQVGDPLDSLGGRMRTEDKSG